MTRPTRPMNAHRPPDPPPRRVTGMRRQRWRLGLDRREVTARLGVPLVTYAAWESGREVPPRRDRPALADVLGVSLAVVAQWIESGPDDPHRIGEPGRG